MAIELPNKRARPVNGHNKSSSNTQGVNKHRGETDKRRKEEAQAATKANQMVMVLEDGRKIRWYRADVWYAMSGHGSPR